MIRLCPYQNPTAQRNLYPVMKALFGPTATVNGWQRTAHWFFVLIFSFVLPFICLGALATPGHPHGVTHFVFAAPPKINASPAMLRTIVLASWCGVPLDSEKADGALETLASIETDDGATPVGQSMSSTVLSALLLLVAGVWMLRRLEMPAFAIFVPYDNSRLIDLLVPTPPPRLPI